MNPKLKKHLITALKIAISAAAVIYLISSIDDKKALIDAFKKANYWWLLPAFLFFNISKIISAHRLRNYFKCASLNLSEGYNLKLYYLGMFYNLFLPGGIGGDGYKVYLLNKLYGTKVKPLISATLLDRLSGVVVLGFLALILILLSTVVAIIPYQNVLIYIGLIISIPVFYVIHVNFFRLFHPEFWRALFWGFGVQLSQLICAAFILLSLQANGSYFDYMTLFLVSSVVAVLPLTIGGIGARELVFLEGVYFFESLQNEASTAVVFSVLFFAITAISSFIGIIYTVKLKAE